MKSILLLLVSLHLFITPCFPQKIGTPGDQPGGLYLPAEGEIRVMVVFVQFPDDNFVPANNSSWPKGGDPFDMEKWLDEKWTDTPVPGSLTDYFNQMSLGKLKMVGEEVSLTTLKTREWYIKEKWSRYHIHRQIIQEQLDPEWDFAEFDKWTLKSRYTHSEGPDGKIDFIFFIWRNVDMDAATEDQIKAIRTMDLGWVGSIGNNPPGQSDSKVRVDDGARYFDFNTFGSGCTIGNYFFKDAFRFAIHEFAHYLLGGNNLHNGHSFWAMLSGYEVRSFMINSWERHRLGWGNVITIPKKTGTVSSLRLTDFITTGMALRIEIDSSSNQYFYIENHQGISVWDKCSSYPEDKGLFVMRQDAFGSGFKGTADWMYLLPAEGRWKWNITRWEPNQWGSGRLPVFQRAEPDRDSGYSAAEFQKMLNPDSKSRNKINYEIIYQEGPNGSINNEPARTGRGRDAFRPGFNEVFSPWSNPDSQDKNSAETGIGFQLISIEKGEALIDIYVNTAIEAPPSKPQGLQLSLIKTDKGSYPQLKWQLNEEPDVRSSPAGYEIERSINGNSFSRIGEVSGMTSEFIDNDNKNTAGRGTRYRIRAKDPQNLKSVYSEEKEIKN